MNHAPDLDLGHGVTAIWTSHGVHERAGLIEYHPCQGGNCSASQCGGGVLFDLPGLSEKFPGRDVWTVESWEPLTLSPSIQCGCRGCSHHGFIRDGRWVPA